MHRKIETLHKLGQMVDQTPKVYLSLARNEAQKNETFFLCAKAGSSTHNFWKVLLEK